MTDWHTFLNSRKAEIVDQHVLDFGDPQQELLATENGNVISDLSHLGLLKVSGEDRESFLQGQLTNDVRQLKGSNSHYTGYCTPKGRMLALFLAFSSGEDIYLQLNRQLLESVSKRLRMYVLRSKVLIEDVSDHFVRIGLAGPEAETILLQQFDQIPKTDHEQVIHPDAIIIRLPGQHPRYELFIPATKSEAFWDTFSRQARPVGAPCWDWLEIKAGIPDILPETQEAFVPQMINLDALGGINFKKGCYTGQEIVARTHYLGKVKRRTLPLHIPSGTDIKAGEPVYLSSPDHGASDSKEAIGVLVRVAPSPRGGFDALAELRLEAMKPESHYSLSGSEECSAVLEALPYSLPD